MNSPDKPRRGRETRKAAPARRNEQASPAGRPYVMAAARIEQVRSVLGEILQWEYPADAALSHWFRAHPKLGARDRGEVAEAVFDVLRHLRRYRQFSESGTDRKSVVSGTSVSVRVDLGGRRSIKKKKK